MSVDLIIGDVVLRRMRGHPWWPGIIVDPRSTPVAVSALYEALSAKARMALVRFYPHATRAEYDVAAVSELVLFDSDTGRDNLSAARKKLSGVKLKKFCEATSEAQSDSGTPRESRKTAFFVKDDDDDDMHEEKSTAAASAVTSDLSDELGASASASASASAARDDTHRKRPRVEAAHKTAPAAIHASAEFSSGGAGAVTADILGSAAFAAADRMYTEASAPAPLLPVLLVPPSAIDSTDLRSRALSLKAALHARAAASDAPGLLVLLRSEACMSLRVTVELLSETKLLDVIKPLQTPPFPESVREAATEVVQLFKGSCKVSLTPLNAALPVVRSVPVPSPSPIVPLSLASTTLSNSSSTTTPRTAAAAAAADVVRLSQPPTTPQRALAVAIIRDLFAESVAPHEASLDVVAAASIDRVCLRLASLIEQSILEHAERTAGADGSANKSASLLEILTFVERVEDDAQPSSSERVRYRRLIAKCASAFHGTPAPITDLEGRLVENAPRLRKILLALGSKSGEMAEREAFAAASLLVR